MKRNLFGNLVRYTFLGLIGLVAVGCENSEITTVTGSITDAVGVPVVAALVVADNGDGSDFTDSEGNFTVEVPADSLDITVTHEQFSRLKVRAVPRYRGEAHFSMEEGDGGPCSRMDINEDGIISGDEWVGPEEVFLAIDSNEDGSLSEDELIAAGDKHREEREVRGEPGRIDTDCDGVISSDEWPGETDKFNEIDTDGNGELSRDEMHAAFEAHRPPMK